MEEAYATEQKLVFRCSVHSNHGVDQEWKFRLTVEPGNNLNHDDVVMCIETGNDCAKVDATLIDNLRRLAVWLEKMAAL